MTTADDKQKHLSVSPFLFIGEVIKEIKGSNKIHLLLTVGDFFMESHD